jgi:hypothetical protein
MISSNELKNNIVPYILPLLFFQITGHQPVFINELKLSDFKQILTKNDIPTDVLGGVLYCYDKTVAIRRVRTIIKNCPRDSFVHVGL